MPSVARARIITESLIGDYVPSHHAWKFHTSSSRFRFLIYGVKSGKCLMADQGVMMSDGTSRRADTLRVGDRIMGYDAGEARPIVVTALEPERKESVELVFRDRSTVRCSWDHRFPVWNNRSNEVEVRRVCDTIRPDGRNKTRYLFLRPKVTHFERRIREPETLFQEMEEEFPIDPYLLGLLLGDGSMTSNFVMFSTASPELVCAVTDAVSEFGLEVNHKSAYDYSITSRGHIRDSGGRNLNPLVSRLRRLGLLGCNSYSKFIPNSYLRSSPENRLDLLAGLIDTDGYVYNQGRMIEYCSMSPAMAEGVRDIVLSLGGYASVRRGHVGQYRLGITLNRSIPCRVPYKKYDGKIVRDKTHIGVIETRHLGQKDCVHISVSGSSECFLLDNFVATHNTLAGAWETARAVLANPGSITWVVAPTYSNLQEAQRNLLEILYGFPGLVEGQNKALHEIYLAGDRMIQCRSAAEPSNLRGPNVDFMWLDEAAFMSEEAFHIARERLMATGGRMIFTTTPDDRNWIWNEIQASGIPTDLPYGNFEKWTDDGGYFVGHWPTWEFNWVKKSEIEAMRKRMTQWEFDREIGAMFTTSHSRVFTRVEDAFTRELPPTEAVDTVLGLDLARHQDWTALAVMEGRGRAFHLDRWNGIEWSMQRERIIHMAKKWNSVICIDGANAGSVIEEDLRDAGLDVRVVNMNSADIKRELIQRLQLSFEQNLIRIPHPKARWASPVDHQLYKELCWYEAGLTRGRRMTYSAPKGLTDDLVIALALAEWGRARGLAGSAAAADDTFSREDWDQGLDSGGGLGNNGGLMRPGSQRLGVFGDVASRGRLFGQDSSGRFWG